MPEPLRGSESPQNHQELVVGCILLLLAEQRSHGYELQDRIRQTMPQCQVSAGNLYRELRRLDAEGLVASVWEASQTRGPARRVYEITNAGRRVLDDWILGLGALVDMLERCIAIHEEFPPPKPERSRKRDA